MATLHLDVVDAPLDRDVLALVDGGVLREARVREIPVDLEARGLRGEILDPPIRSSSVRGALRDVRATIVGVARPGRSSAYSCTKRPFCTGTLCPSIVMRPVGSVAPAISTLVRSVVTLRPGRSTMSVEYGTRVWSSPCDASLSGGSTTYSTVRS